MHERAVDEPRRPDLESLGLLPAKLRNPLRGRDIVQLEIPCALHVADPECHHLRKLPRFPRWVYWLATWSQCMPRLGAQLHALRRSVTSTVPATCAGSWKRSMTRTWPACSRLRCKAG